MTTSSPTAAPAATITECPEWCSVTHDRAGGFHASEVFGAETGIGARLFKPDTIDARAQVVLQGVGLSEEQALAFARVLNDMAFLLSPEDES